MSKGGKTDVITKINKKDELLHYRTPGSKNGIRLYQYENGELTPLGKKRYLKGETKGNKHYYDPGYKPGFFDFYGREKKNKLNNYVKKVGNKNYKGYERAESKESKYTDPKEFYLKTRRTILWEKPSSVKKRREEWAKSEEWIEALDEKEKRNRESSFFVKTDKQIQNKINEIIAYNQDKNISSNLITSLQNAGGRPNLLFYYHLTKNFLNDKKFQDSDKEMPSGMKWQEHYQSDIFEKDIDYLPKDVQINNEEAYIKIGWRRFKNFCDFIMNKKIRR